MIYSKTSEYAIRALIYFADYPKEKGATVKQVSKDSGIPSSYVAKIFQCLVHADILKSRRGARGGYQLAQSPSRLTLLRVIESLDDRSQSPFSQCCMGFEKCEDRTPCPLHDVWADAKEKMRDRLSKKTIADLAGLGKSFKGGKRRRTILSKGMRSIFST